MVAIMRGSPALAADVAELVATTAGHVVATLVLFDNEFALFALPIMQIALKKHDLLAIAFS